MRHHLKRLHVAMQPLPTEITLPSSLLFQTSLLTAFALRVKWSSLVLTPILILVARDGSAVSTGALWPLAAAAAVDRSVLSYQRYRRR
ncbi:hypothetical protein ACFW9I_22695 [[Kitasatospora] papulosa]|uniref:hypothetical protein n=1 Tax=[Kitasatospora] papulosa TaxID=1464011 RepID=UPI00367620FB